MINSEKNIRFTITIPKDLNKKLVKYAKINSFTKSKIIVLALEEFLKDKGKEEN